MFFNWFLICMIGFIGVIDNVIFFNNLDRLGFIFFVLIVLKMEFD